MISFKLTLIVHMDTSFSQINVNMAISNNYFLNDAIKDNIEVRNYKEQFTNLNSCTD
jgi:hypothetical protein